MKTIKNFGILLLLLISLYGNARQTDQVRSKTYAAYLKNSLSLWEQAIEDRKAAVGTSGDKGADLHLAIAYYGYMSATMATQDEDSFKKYLDPAKDHLKKMISENAGWGEPKAILSSVMGLEIAYSPLKGAYLGMKSSSLMSDAMKEDPDSPIVLQLYAGSKQYTPEMWGGDMKVAAEYMQKCITAYEKSGDIAGNWMYADALANLGIIYASIDQKVKAKGVFEKALAYEPDFQWVKYSLLPQVADNGKE